MSAHKRKITQYIGDAKARYVLATEGERPLLVIGLNPSKADDQSSDQTFSKVLGFAERAGFDGIMMMNLYPQRATQPKQLHKRRNSQFHQNNLNHLHKILVQNRDIQILAAWGAGLEIRKYLSVCLNDIYQISQNYDCKWLQIGQLTKQGHPRHPSRTAYALGLNPFELEEYLISIVQGKY
ncbi:MAG: DUF1643 domain-containing protein [Bacteroidota bacterium]